MTPTAPVPVLALDGPSGSGKGTVGQRLARRLGWRFLDSGALYRALGVAAAKAGIDLNDRPAVARLALAIDIRFVPRAAGDTVGVLLNGEEIGEALRTEEGGRLASVVAAIPEVRRALLQKQHAFRLPPGLVADGRDMGSTVFPDAILKIYLTASPEVRAQRRYKQLKEKGFDVNLQQLLDEIRERDTRDAGRAASPLKPAPDACIVDTSQLDISGVVERIYGLLQERQRRG
ncbi:MAG TPA: (d)CMP kinase [Candidatus Methylomirabilis sp.]|nr:(d)CMP kinase [Candidatus Methylomirabilis sp.]